MTDKPLTNNDRTIARLKATHADKPVGPRTVPYGAEDFERGGPLTPEVKEVLKQYSNPELRELVNKKIREPRCYSEEELQASVDRISSMTHEEIHSSPFDDILKGRLPKEHNGISTDSEFFLEAKLSEDPEPELRGETTFGLNPKWIDWYCRTSHTAVWKARKVGKAKLRKLQELKARFNK